MKTSNRFRIHVAKSRGFENYERGNVAFITNGFYNNGVQGYVAPLAGDGSVNLSGDKNNGFWATGEKGTLQIILFLLTLGATLTISIYPSLGSMVATISFVGVMELSSYAYYTALLSKKEIISAVGSAIFVGIIATIPPYILVHLAKPQLLLLQVAVGL